MWSDDGGGAAAAAANSNRLAMGPVARKALFLSLQAGAVAHLSLKERRAAEVPWIEVGVCVCGGVFFALSRSNVGQITI